VIQFEYTSVVNTGGYNKIAADGGCITHNGEKLRITYTELPKNNPYFQSNVIVKIETL
jgi:hypothetical protein